MNHLTILIHDNIYYFWNEIEVPFSHINGKIFDLTTILFKEINGEKNESV